MIPPISAGDASLPREIRLKDGTAAIMRRLEESDAEQVCRLLPLAHRESDFLNFLPGEFDWPPDRERDFIREHQRQAHSIIFCAERGGELLALCGARQLSFRRFAHQAEVGITVFKKYWGLGLGRQMMAFVVAWSQVGGLRKLTLRVFADNVRAINLYQSLGFVEEGRLRGDALRADGTYTETMLMGLFHKTP